MKNSNKVLITIIVTLLIILLIAGGALAYAYLATDIFKTDKEMFFKNLAQIISKENGFFDTRIDKFYEKKKQVTYENSGEITLDIEFPDEITGLAADKLKKVNDLVISYSGMTDSANQKVEQEIKIDYGNDVILPINYKQDGNAIGLQTDELSKKYIAVRNENLDELATNIGFGDFWEIPNNIEVSEEVEKVSVTDQEIEQLKEIYMPILQENLIDEHFSRTETEQSESFTLELKNGQIKNLIIKILETSKQNTLIIDKINEIMLEQNADAEKIEVSAIDDLIKEINSEEISKNIPNLKLTLVQSNKLLERIIIQLNENIITIEKTNETDNVSYNFNCQLDTNAIVGDSSNSGDDSDENTELTQASIFFNIQYKGLNTLAKVNENYNFGFDISTGKNGLRCDYQILNNTEFMNNLSFDDLDEHNAVFLNDYNKDQIQPFLIQVGTRLLEINKKQMEKLGLKGNENPIILYSEPITMLGLMVYNMASEPITNVDFSSMEVSAFNDKFTSYEGEGVKGTTVNVLIATTKKNNVSSDGVAAIHQVKVTLDGTEVLESIDQTKTYNVEAIYDVNGYIVEMRVTTNN